MISLSKFFASGGEIREWKTGLTRWATENMIFGVCNIWFILRRNVMHVYSKKPDLDQLFHYQRFQT
jgi:hypothetical protein